MNRNAICCTSKLTSDTDPHPCPRSCGRNGGQQLRHDWAEVRKPIRMRIDHNHAERERGNVLLIREIAVHRDQDIADGGGAAYQLSILRAGPS